MEPITIWKMCHKHKDKTETWEHNHIENGHSHRNEPHAKSQFQKHNWANQKWQRIHAYLDNNIVCEEK